MKTLIIFFSKHQSNTERIAKEMGKILEALLLKPELVDIDCLAENDLIGFGSGVY